jgi:hypothetical protein
MATLNPKIIVGNDFVVASGSLCFPASQTITLEPIPLGQSALSLELVFETDTTQGQIIYPKVIPPTVVRLRILNFDNALGTATTKPVEIGWVGEPRRKMFMYLVARLIGTATDGVRLLDYTITAEGRQDV